ncbi:MAG TPA: ABC transporter permease subunit [Clostridia bacterium]|nr:ABC transporter permease subunit [Clostridia bacterium]
MQTTAVRPPFRQRFALSFQRYWMLYLMVTPLLLYYILFCYLPMFGIVIAFQDFRVTRGFFDSKWVGLKHFHKFFASEYAWTTIRNTLLISAYGLIFGFPAPILLALMLNEAKQARFKKAVQLITYMPHFISLVVVCAIVRDFCATSGIINSLLAYMGRSPVNFMTEPGWFRPLYIVSGIWQHMGWDSIIYLASLSAIDPELYEAATVDGAGRMRKIWHITLPGISATITILLILRIGSIMSVGFEKIILLYTPLTYETADVISTHVYRRGLIDGDYSFASAVGLMNSVVNLVLLISADRFSKKIGQRGLF